MPKHKHADLIIAWANGAEIECKHLNGWGAIVHPSWDSNVEYRIKPKPKPNGLTWKEPEEIFKLIANGSLSYEEFKEWLDSRMRDDYTRGFNAGENRLWD